MRALLLVIVVVLGSCTDPANPQRESPLSAVPQSRTEDDGTYLQRIDPLGFAPVHFLGD
jgi:hypothetical protein